MTSLSVEWDGAPSRAVTVVPPTGANAPSAEHEPGHTLFARRHRPSGARLHGPLPLARKAAVLTRFWQVVPQNRRVPLRETST
ncbi:hypothetical protein GCM10018952_62280 [Streptosporangium vulgare]